MYIDVCAQRGKYSLDIFILNDFIVYQVAVAVAVFPTFIYFSNFRKLK